MRMVVRGLAGLALALSIGLPPAGAQGSPSAGTQPDQVEQVFTRYNMHPAIHKLGRGVVNALFGFAEVPINIQKRFNSRDTAGSFMTGALYGVFEGLARTGVGVYETVTFFLPYPENFAPILPTLAYFDRSKRQTLPLE